MAIWPFSMKSGQDTAQRSRLALSSLWTPSRDAPLKVTTGLINDGGGVVTVVPGTMDVSVTPFRGMVQGTVSGTQGGYPVVSDTNLTTTLPNGGGGAVQYTIAAIVEDSAFDLSGQQRVRLVSYTTAGGPPTNSGVIPLRQLNLRAGVSVGTGGLLGSDLNTDFRVYTVAVGGILPCLSSGRPGSPAIGSWVYETDTGILRVWTGAVWKAMRKDVLITVDRYTASDTWSKPNDVKIVRGRGVAGGGGGGGCVGQPTGQGAGGGGGGGAYWEKVWDAASLAASVPITVGGTGLAGISTAPSGGTGGTTSMDVCSATGGQGGNQGVVTTADSAGAGGLGGTATGGDINKSGEPGGAGRIISGRSTVNNHGGASMFGAGVRAILAAAAGSAGLAYGGGAGGSYAVTGSQSGGTGASGLVIVENVF
jgi:hypothetical protein